MAEIPQHIYISVVNTKRLDASLHYVMLSMTLGGRTPSILNLNASFGCVPTTSNLKGHAMADLQIMEEVVKFLKECGAYFLATVDGDQPKVRPFGTAEIFEGKLYIQTGKSKNVSKQIAANPKVQLCAMNKAGNQWLRLSGTLVEDDRLEPKVHAGRLSRTEGHVQGRRSQHSGALLQGRRGCVLQFHCGSQGGKVLV